MGQNASNEANKSDATVLEHYSWSQINEKFFNDCVLELSKEEITWFLNNVNATSFTGNKTIESNEMPFVFQLMSKNQQLDSLHPEFWTSINIIHESLKIMGHFPFLQEYGNCANTTLKIKNLLVSTIFHSGKYQGIIGSDFDYNKLLFISLSLHDSKFLEQWEKVEDSNKTLSLQDQNRDSTPYVVQLRVDKGKNENNDDKDANIIWNSFEVIKHFDGIDVNNLKVKAYDLVQVITFCLIISSLHGRIPLSQSILIDQFSKEWSNFQEYGISMVRFFNTNITAKNYESMNITFTEFNYAMNQYQLSFIRKAFTKIFKEGLLAIKDTFNQKAPMKPNVDVNTTHVNTIVDANTKSVLKKHVEFVPSRLVNESSISVISSILEGKKSNISISKDNLIKLYAGSESGFSIRSLESKVFKWQAPTILLVSGKRLKDKITKSNTRYQKFDHEYPAYFRSNETHKRDWQGESDKIFYAVVINSPWKHSNKKNFGDENSVIINLLPRLDSYASVHNTILNSESIYFNNTGMGLGFGNEQPVNKNGVRKYVPGTVSLTIEANLEFAIFRHISSPSKNSVSFFKTSNQLEVSQNDFEDRFIITDLEVWGIGSTKELDEQRKQWEWEEKQAEARKGVNLRSLGEERAFLEMVGLVGNHNSTGGSV